MTKRTPQPDGWDESGKDGIPDADDRQWSVEGSAGRGGIAADEADAAARAYWEGEADTYQAEHGAFLAGAGVRVVESRNSVTQIDYADREAADGAGFVWGPEGVTENELQLLGPADRLRGQRVLEVGCGAAQCSAWLAALGVDAIGVDIAVNQLRHAPRLGRDAGLSSKERSDCQIEDNLVGEAPGRLAVVAATATALPFADGMFEGAFSSYGAVQFVADLPPLLGEVRRVLRPGGFWVFSVTHHVRWAFPDVPDAAGLTAVDPFTTRDTVERETPAAAATSSIVATARGVSMLT